MAKSLVEGDTWYDAAMINEGICDWTTRPEKARGANGYHAFREFIEADNILYSLRLSSGPGGAYPDGDLCRRKIQRDIPVVFVHAAEDNIAPMDEIMGFSNRQRAMNRRITFLKFAGLPPPGHFNLMDGVPMWFDQKSADQVFNQIFHDLESDTVAR